MSYHVAQANNKPSLYLRAHSSEAFARVISLAACLMACAACPHGLCSLYALSCWYAQAHLCLSRRTSRFLLHRSSDSNPVYTHTHTHTHARTCVSLFLYDVAMCVCGCVYVCVCVCVCAPHSPGNLSRVTKSLDKWNLGLPVLLPGENRLLWVPMCCTTAGFTLRTNPQGHVHSTFRLHGATRSYLGLRTPMIVIA